MDNVRLQSPVNITHRDMKHLKQHFRHFSTLIMKQKHETESGLERDSYYNLVVGYKNAGIVSKGL